MLSHIVFDNDDKVGVCIALKVSLLPTKKADKNITDRLGT